MHMYQGNIASASNEAYGWCGHAATPHSTSCPPGAIYTIPELAIDQASAPMWGQPIHPASSAWSPLQILPQHAMLPEAQRAMPLTSQTGQPPDDEWFLDVQTLSASSCPADAKVDSQATPSESSLGPATAKADEDPWTKADEDPWARDRKSGERHSRASKDDTNSSSDNDAYRRGPKYSKKRSGRSVRDRKEYRISGDRGERDERVPKHRNGRTSYRSDRHWKQPEFLLHATRFGLFCAMAWSMNSILFALMRIMQDGSIPHVEG